MGDCYQEGRIQSVEKETAVQEAHISNISDTVKTMQRWIIGFIISVLLLVYGTTFKNLMETNKVQAKEIVECKNQP